MQGPKSVRLILPRLLSFLAVRNEWAHTIVTSSDGEWDSLHGRANMEYAPHNKWLAYTLKQLFARPSANTAAFESLVIDLAAPEHQIDTVAGCSSACRSP